MAWNWKCLIPIDRSRQEYKKLFNTEPHGMKLNFFIQVDRSREKYKNCSMLNRMAWNWKNCYQWIGLVKNTKTAQCWNAWHEIEIFRYQSIGLLKIFSLRGAAKPEKPTERSKKSKHVKRRISLFSAILCTWGEIYEHLWKSMKI